MDKGVIKKLAKRIIPHKVMELYREHHGGLSKKDMAEQHKSFGTLNPDKTFYVIRRPPRGTGLFSNYHWVLGHILYAVIQGWIPIVDMENYKTHYNEDVPINGTMNAWEYYFRQPCNYTLDEVYKSQNVVLAKMEYIRSHSPSMGTDDQVALFSSLVERYIHINDTTMKQVDEVRKKLFSSRKNILGVAYRGSDYAKITPKGHSVVAPIDDYLTRVQTFLNEWGMEWVYLSTEEQETVDIFQQTFGDKLLIMDRMRIKGYSADMGYIPKIGFGRENDNYLKGLEYLIETVLLSECDAFVGPLCNGTLAAWEINAIGQKYKHRYIYSLGTN